MLEERGTASRQPGCGADLLQELDRRRADSAGGAVDEHVLAAPDLGRPDRRAGVMRALAAGRRLLEGPALRDGRHQPALGHDQVLGVGPEGSPTLNPNTRSPTLTAVNPVADRLDL